MLFTQSISDVVSTEVCRYVLLYLSRVHMKLTLWRATMKLIVMAHSITRPVVSAMSRGNSVRSCSSELRMYEMYIDRRLVITTVRTCNFMLQYLYHRLPLILNEGNNLLDVLIIKKKMITYLSFFLPSTFNS